ncbi:MAG: diphosphomevalonate decarboxylase [Bacteriovoracaceae bacterium]|nr:diphosphomevalonate decarboxylase [Bacteriovoracaceae bacterium]
MSISNNQIIDRLGSCNTLSWKAPSNIALIKYWGKKDFQIPANSSISMTLNNCYTNCIMEFIASDNFSVSLEFENKSDDSFLKKVTKHISRIAKDFPVLKSFSYTFKTSNTFPHSAGIASSASSMAAINLCLTELLVKLDEVPNEDFFRFASDHARQGSGSASRSLYGGFVDWGATSNDYGSVQDNIHEDFIDMGDAVLIVDSGVKEVSSSKGHQLMMSHPQREERFSAANAKTKKMIEILKDGDWNSFIPLLESEALELHGLMMSGTPWFILMKPETLALLDLFKKWRNENSVRAAFTLDAGPNIHLLYHKDERDRVLAFINEQAISHLENEQWIDDKMGMGPEKVIIQ